MSKASPAFWFEMADLMSFRDRRGIEPLAVGVKAKGMRIKSVHLNDMLHIITNIGLVP